MRDSIVPTTAEVLKLLRKRDIVEKAIVTRGSLTLFIRSFVHRYVLSFVVGKICHPHQAFANDYGDNRSASG